MIQGDVQDWNGILLERCLFSKVKISMAFLRYVLVIQ